jgi:hypothetical protein
VPERRELPTQGVTALGHLAEAREDREMPALVHDAIISYVR